MRSRSVKRAQQERLYAKLRKIFLREKPLCEACEGPPSKATQVHHIAGREGWLLVHVKYFLAVCAPCHRWIEDNGKEAAKRGWKVELPTLMVSHREEIKQHAELVVRHDALKTEVPLRNPYEITNS